MWNVIWIGATGGKRGLRIKEVGDDDKTGAELAFGLLAYGPDILAMARSENVQDVARVLSDKHQLPVLLPILRS